MTKESLRRLIRQRKQLLSLEERERQSNEIMSLLEDKLVFQKARVILLYASLPDEVQTQALLERWYKQKRILLPVVCGEELELREYKGGHTMHKGCFGILEPHESPLFIDFSLIDLAIIPGLAFTPDGKRLGRGKGYYDRLLAQGGFQSVHKIGFAYTCQMLSELPISPHDILLDEVITSDSVKSTIKNL
jgi:5-formyltetrahydrofolate cyclo-ligase